MLGDQKILFDMTSLSGELHRSSDNLACAMVEIIAQTYENFFGELQ